MPRKFPNSPEARAYQKRWEAENKEKALQYRREYYARNRVKRNERQRELYQINREYHRVKEAEYRTHPINRIKMLIGNARVRARKTGREFDVKAFKPFLENPPTHCFCCGKELSYALGNGHGHKNNPHAPSLDRKDNRIGYVPGNVFLVCFRCNWVKNDATASELLTVVAYMTDARQKNVA